MNESLDLLKKSLNSARQSAGIILPLWAKMQE
jgi:hypothetical protein